MIEILRTLSSVSVVVFAASSMLTAGFSFTVKEVVGPLRRPHRIARALIGNFVLVPLLAVIIARALALDSALALGLILLGSADERHRPQADVRVGHGLALERER